MAEALKFHPSMALTVSSLLVHVIPFSCEDRSLRNPGFVSHIFVSRGSLARPTGHSTNHTTLFHSRSFHHLPCFRRSLFKKSLEYVSVELEACDCLPDAIE